MIDFAALAAPFSPASVSWRIGSTTSDKSKGMALAYLDARDVMDRLDEVCTAGGWQATYPHAGQKTVCSIGILCGDHWVWKSNGAGDSDIEAEKGALSDAFKRAAVLWGVGRYLYNLQSPWVEIETRGRTSIIKEHEYARLADILHRQFKGEPPRRALPPSEGDIAEGSLRWVQDQKALLSSIASNEDVQAWRKTNEKNLAKLFKENQPLHGDVKAAYQAALDRTNMGARLQ
jgi:hypothetical protein